MTDISPTQAAIDFLSSLDEAACLDLPQPFDYAALVELANRRGAHTNEAALREAFAMIIRARLFASVTRGLAL